MAQTGSDTVDRVHVAVRVRPFGPNDQRSTAVQVLPDDHIDINGKLFRFDYVFDQHSQQEDVYCACVTNMIDAFFEGFNCTVFAYGQTGAGKTHTMGATESCDVQESDLGIIPRLIRELFARIQVRCSDGFCLVLVLLPMVRWVSSPYLARILARVGC